MFFADYHTHSDFSSDSDTPMEENIKKAISIGLKEIAATDHIDFDYPDPDYPFLFDYEPYSKEIERLRNKYKGQIKILKGVEIGIQPHVMNQITDLVSKNRYDFIIGSTHVVQDGYDLCVHDFFDGKTQNEAYGQYFDEVLHNVKNYDFFNVYGHIDFINRYGDYQNKVIDYKLFMPTITKIFKTLIEKSKGIEVNTSGYRYGVGGPHPQFELIKLYHDLGGKIITVGSDTHKPEQMAYKFDEAYKMIKEAGFDSITAFENKEPRQIKLF